LWLLWSFGVGTDAATSDNLQSDKCKIPGHAYLLENPGDVSLKIIATPPPWGRRFQETRACVLTCFEEVRVDEVVLYVLSCVHVSDDGALVS
jgi:hypothetical protein